MLTLGDALSEETIDGPPTLVINNKSDCALLLKNLKFNLWTKTESLECENLSELSYLPS